MATTTQPATGETTKQLINYRTDAGVAVVLSAGALATMVPMPESP